VRVRFLGTAAGGGLPQWNCGCPGCVRARRTGTGRLQDSLAVTGDGSRWYLLNASPDAGRQVAAAPELAPAPGSRATPVRGVLLSSAELDHTIGLLSLREAQALTVYATGPVLAALSGPFPVRSMLAGYAEVSWRAAVPGRPLELDGGLRAEAVAVGTKRPRYAAGLSGVDGDCWVAAWRLSDPRTGGVLVYAPCLPHWLPELADGADHVVLDGTFHAAGEMAGRAVGAPAGRAGPTGGTSRQASMVHLPVADSLRLLPPGPRYHYTHLNNTNPLVDPAAPERAGLAGAGAEVAEDGLVLEIWAALTYGVTHW
jgi:pyrroloquinoline quinone biosynthesis protein B